jgi:membrane-associated protease RseP (regulator of RpoE activity)
MMWMVMVLSLMPAQDPKVDLGKAKLFIYDASKGITLRVDKDGKVELTVSEEGKDKKTYVADGVDEFRKKHPDAVRKHGLERYLGGPRLVAPEEFDKWWEDFRKNRRFIPDVPEFRDPFDEDWQKWMDEQRKQFDDLRRLFRRPGQEPGPAPAPAPAPAPLPADREFGIKVGAVPETLRDQLSLGEGEGIVVEEVKPGSVAGKTGLQKHDIILKVDGKGVADKWQFRRDVQEALGKKEFPLEILRGGKRETLKAKPGGKDE